MGWISNSADKVRKATAQDPRRKAAEVAKGQVPGAALIGAAHMNVLGGLYGEQQPIIEIEGDLHRRYVDYENMDDYPELSTALDIYADDATQPDWQRQMSIWVTSEDHSLKKELTELYHGRLNIEEDLHPNTRTVCKYGNGFAEILLAEKGVVGLNYLPPPSARRVIESKGSTIGYVQDPQMRFLLNSEAMRAMLIGEKVPETPDGPMHGQIAYFEPWEMVHWRLRSKHMRSIYGHSVLDPARWVWRRLSLLEDAVLMYRLTRSPERFAFYVDVGSMPANEALNYVNKVRNQFKKRKFYNPEKGGLDMRYNPLSHTDDFWVPSRDGKDSTRIESLGGLQYQAMDDIEYFRKKLAAAIKVPAVHLGFEAEPVGQHLSHTDVRFARTVLRVQGEMKRGYKQVGMVHMTAIGKEPRSLTAWDLEMATPTLIYELAVMEALSTKNSIARDMEEQVSVMWVLQNVYKFTEEESKEILKQQREDKIRKAIDEAEAEAAAEAIRRAAEEQNEDVQFSDRFMATQASRAVTDKDVERIVTEGSRKSEKRMTDRIDELLASQNGLAKTIKRNEALMIDLRMAMRSRN